MASEDTFTAEVPKSIESTAEYDAWLSDVTGTDLARAEAAKIKMTSEGVVTSAKNLGEGLYEKKWKSGLRVYFAVVRGKGGATLLLLGSGKGREQNRAITDCRKILKGHQVFEGDIRKKD